MNIVSTMTTKEDRIYIRVTDEIKEKFRIVAEHRGLKMSALLHSLVVKTVREEEREFPFLFGHQKAHELNMFTKSTDFIEVEDRGPLTDETTSNVTYFPHKGSEIQELGSSNNFSDDEGKFKNYSLDPPDGEIDPVLEEEIKKIEARRKATGKDDSED